MCAAQAPMPSCISCMSQQGLLATCLVLERDAWERVGLESENSSGAAWRRRRRRVEIWELEIWKSEKLEIQKCGIQTKHKTRVTKSKPMSPHMCGVVGISSWPHFMAFVTNFPMDRKMQKQSKKLRISVGGPMLLSILGEVIGVYRISLMIKVAPSPNFIKVAPNPNFKISRFRASRRNRGGGGENARGGKGGGSGKGNGKGKNGNGPGGSQIIPPEMMEEAQGDLAELKGRIHEHTKEMLILPEMMEEAKRVLADMKRRIHERAEEILEAAGRSEDEPEEDINDWNPRGLVCPP